jgi:hypothetical protein
MDDAVTILEQIIEGHPWTEESARAQGFGCADAAVSRIVRSAAFDEEAAWEAVERDFEELVLVLGRQWGLPNFCRGILDKPGDQEGDFFSAPSDWPPVPATSTGAERDEPDGLHAAAQLFREAERAAGWQRGDVIAYVALETLDNTRIRALVVGVLPWEE